MSPNPAGRADAKLPPSSCKSDPLAREPRAGLDFVELDKEKLRACLTQTELAFPGWRKLIALLRRRTHASW
jgi:hypothetical protein